ncbi:TIGR00304 family membrane protein [Metallosphaera hakonensis]|uniref:TIGR00304 family membrane protein n=1 Tax=Metallosphaera hakonensis TaxID=79601 RepID=UPI002092AF52|nr:DUF131 domain-containing protein [Metallosphaera hakonensis]
MRLTLIGIIVILIGFALVFAGSVSSISPSNSTVGGVVLIGPIPIIFGKGSEGNLIPLMIIGSFLQLSPLYSSWDPSGYLESLNDTRN